MKGVFAEPALKASGARSIPSSDAEDYWHAKAHPLVGDDRDRTNTPPTSIGPADLHLRRRQIPQQRANDPHPSQRASKSIAKPSLQILTRRR
jgi:hypothetical protein